MAPHPSNATDPNRAASTIDVCEITEPTASFAAEAPNNAGADARSSADQQEVTRINSLGTIAFIVLQKTKKQPIVLRNPTEELRPRSD